MKYVESPIQVSDYETEKKCKETKNLQTLTKGRQIFVDELVSAGSFTEL